MPTEEKRQAIHQQTDTDQQYFLFAFFMMRLPFPFLAVTVRDPAMIGAVSGFIMSRCTSKQCHQGCTQNAQPPVLVERFCYGTGGIIRLTFETGQPCRKIADFLPFFRHDGSALSEIALLK